ncbi:hypothetical protein ACHAWF_018759 [Thalassiosira exigua]
MPMPSRRAAESHEAAASSPRPCRRAFLLRTLGLLSLGLAAEVLVRGRADLDPTATTAGAEEETRAADFARSLPPYNDAPPSTIAIPSSEKARKALASSSRSWNVERLFDYFPRPKTSDTVRIYHEEAHRELARLLLRPATRQGGRAATVTICANGGSATAGGGRIPKLERFHRRFAAHLERLSPDLSIDVVDRGHGTRGTLHSAVFAANFLPPDADLIFWEFSINDSDYEASEQRSALIAWLTEASRLRPGDPPKVILVYLWKWPFGHDDEGRVVAPVFEAHQGVAERFDFVVGHVNLASYMDELAGAKGGEARSLNLKRLLVQDGIHPSRMGHSAVAYLLLCLLEGGRREWRERPRMQPPDRPDSAPSRTQQSAGNIGAVNDVSCEWTCGADAPEMEYVRSQVEARDPSTASFGWRSPLATATLERPRNDEDAPTAHASFGTWPMTTRAEKSDYVALHGKADPLRDDRQISVMVPCCAASRRSSIDLPRRARPLDNATSLFLGLYPERSDVETLEVTVKRRRSFFGTNRGTVVDGRIVRGLKEPSCMWSWRRIYDAIWYDFADDAQDGVAKIEFCVENQRCAETEGHYSSVRLMAVAVY